MFTAKQARQEYQKHVSSNGNKFLEENKEKIIQGIKFACMNDTATSILFNSYISQHQKSAVSDWLEEFGYETSWLEYEDYDATGNFRASTFKLTISW